MTIDISFEGVQEAGKRISDYIIKTPLIRMPSLDSSLNCQVYVKPENLQTTGSFKLRGAVNSLLVLSEEEKSYGVVCASSGNHATGIAWAAQQLGISAKIVMQENCNPVKLENVKSLGAEVCLVGVEYSNRETKVREIVENEKRIEIHPYAGKYVKEGQGTIALEILEDQSDINVIVAPLGGGGLLSGIAVAAKSLKPDIKVIGIEPASANRYRISLDANEPLNVTNVDTIADGTRTEFANESNLEIIKNYVDEIRTVDDEEIKAAMRLMIHKGKMVIEPSSAMVIAAFMNEKIITTENDKVCFVLSGGNNDIELLTRILTEK